MKVTKKHLAYLAVLAIGGGWLSMDYFTGSAPGVSAASAAIVASDDAVTSNPAPTALAADMGDEPAIAHRLDKLNQSHVLTGKNTLDGFALPSAFVTAAPTPAASAIPVVTAASTFSHDHTLTSVMVGGRSSSALVDGKSLLKIGDKLDGFVLMEVTKTGAVFTSTSGARAVLGFNFPSASLSTASVQGQ
jgi:hypothetical protein